MKGMKIRDEGAVDSPGLLASGKLQDFGFRTTVWLSWACGLMCGIELLEVIAKVGEVSGYSSGTDGGLWTKLGGLRASGGFSATGGFIFLSGKANTSSAPGSSA